MRIETKAQNKKSDSVQREIFLVLLKMGIIFAVFIAAFVTVIMLGRTVKTFWQESAHTVKVSIDDADAKHTLSGTAESVSYGLPRSCSDNYLRIGVSGADVYKVAFYDDDEIDYFIINTSAVSDTEFLYFIPDRITEKGYRQITVSPLSGDGEYWVQHVETYSSPNFNDFSACQIVDYEIEKMELTISEEDYARIIEKRASALQLGILISDDSDYVTAKISADGKTDSAQVRLKGDWVDHLQGDKWSLRIKLDNECFWGMDEMSIQTPETRNNIGEYLIHRFYSQLGGVSLRYKFVDVIINSEYSGVYAVEEAFDKRAVENSQKREGVIIKYNESYLWEKWAYYLDPTDTSYNRSEIANFEPFGLKKTWESETLSGYASYAIDSLNRFTAGKASAPDVFDLDMYAKYLAMLDIFQSSHGNTWHNMRFYYNPVTAKLEPITFDEYAMYSAFVAASKKNDPIISKLFQDEAFVDLYIKYVKEILDEYGAFIESEKTNLEQIEYILSRDSITYDDYATVLDTYHDEIRNSFSDQTVFFGEINDDNQVVITIQNDGFFNIDLVRVTFAGAPVDIDLSNYSTSISINTGQLGAGQMAIDWSQLEVTYITIFDGQEHTQPVQFISDLGAAQQEQP